MVVVAVVDVVVAVVATVVTGGAAVAVAGTLDALGCFDASCVHLGILRIHLAMLRSFLG